MQAASRNLERNPASEKAIAVAGPSAGLFYDCDFCPILQLQSQMPPVFLLLQPAAGSSVYFPAVQSEEVNLRFRWLAPAIVQAWREFSAAFSEFPFGGGLYTAPMQFGPANLLWAEPTNYAAGPVAFPYDDLDGWCAPYPTEVFIGQFEKIAGGFEQALAKLKHTLDDSRAKLTREESHALTQELNVAEAAGIHFRSTANQCRFVLARRSLAAAKNAADAAPARKALEATIKHELALARKLYEIQMRDSRIGFEASNQYYYVPMDLAEKVLNCRWLLEQGEE